MKNRLSMPWNSSRVMMARAVHTCGLQGREAVVRVGGGYITRQICRKLFGGLVAKTVQRWVTKLKDSRICRSVA